MTKILPALHNPDKSIVQIGYLALSYQGKQFNAEAKKIMQAAREAYNKLDKFTAAEKSDFKTYSSDEKLESNLKTFFEWYAKHCSPDDEVILDFNLGISSLDHTAIPSIIEALQAIQKACFPDTACRLAIRIVGSGGGYLAKDPKDFSVTIPKPKPKNMESKTENKDETLTFAIKISRCTYEQSRKWFPSLDKIGPGLICPTIEKRAQKLERKKPASGSMSESQARPTSAPTFSDTSISDDGTASSAPTNSDKDVAIHRAASDSAVGGFSPLPEPALQVLKMDDQGDTPRSIVSPPGMSITGTASDITSSHFHSIAKDPATPQAREVSSPLEADASAPDASPRRKSTLTANTLARSGSPVHTIADEKKKKITITTPPAKRPKRGSGSDSE